jgi:hypothetical protein
MQGEVFSILCGVIINFTVLGHIKKKKRTSKDESKQRCT